MKRLKIALVSHIIKEANLGCGALAISNIKLLDQVLDRFIIDAEYLSLIHIYVHEKVSDYRLRRFYRLQLCLLYAEKV